MPQPKTTIDDKLHWYKDAVIYELHIKAFRDGNGDGIGDFQGLMEKLDYLEDLGITAIWVLPFYPSPLRDDGYDIADYYSINPSYGDIRQFKKFLDEAHKRNLKVITELVINHTSDQHPWFQRARMASKGSPERNYYVWTDDPGQYKDVRIIFQDFETSNWTWDPQAGQYFWHRFFHHQPDLNYDSPLVQEEVFKILDYWCEMGVDGFRLDAVPYLFEREGTNGENLPETHAFLKKLRAHIDERYPSTVLLAEANMWPEDSASYFGNGDECHMNYHFPVMPRMFMALQMEDRYPVTDIFEQTPAIPETCQWAIFLRNHDELTLEMVTDEERDYMYKVYVKDPKARINLGIRHRLAPLMENDRRKIELLNSLLFSLAGTPVIYYGDEIGMGDNFYLGDRDGVRTPMQWSPDRNAGFSETNPQKLYLPVILDPEYQYESVNVENQRRNTSSLLWFMKRIISLRKKHRAFGRGDMKFIQVENPKVLAFTRTYEAETILVIVNLSRYSQPAEMDLPDHKGFQPVELVSKNRFPLINEDGSCFFTLGAYDYQWYVLDKLFPEAAEAVSLPMLQLDEWQDLVKKNNLEQLAGNAIHNYLLKASWFRGKNRQIDVVTILDHASLPLPECDNFLLLVEVSYKSGLPEKYQLPMSFIKESTAQKMLANIPNAVISRIRIGEEDGVLCDALFVPEVQRAIFTRIAHSSSIPLGKSEIIFYGHRDLKKYVAEQPEIKSKVLPVEDDNTSIGYDNNYFLKIYRHVDNSINPDVELTRYLSEQANFKQVPAFLGAVEWKYSNDSIVLGMMQNLVEYHGNGRTFMLERLHNFNEKILSLNYENRPSFELKGSLVEPVAFQNLTADLKELLGGHVAEAVRLIGLRTGEMHKALASGSYLKDFMPEDFSLHYQRSLYAGLLSLVRGTFQDQSDNVKKLPEDLKKQAEKMLSRKHEVLGVLKKIYAGKLDVVKIRIHGNYHLGQILFTGKDLAILDFGGDPYRSYSERRLKRSPLRDVAGMIRSFYYVAHEGLLLNNGVRNEDIQKLEPFVRLWTHYVSGFFMHAYLEAVEGSLFIPKNKEDLEMMLRTYLLEKSIYSLNYELNHRPERVSVPLGIIGTVLET